MNFCKFISYNLSLILICSNSYYVHVYANEKQNLDISNSNCNDPDKIQEKSDSSEIEKRSNCNLIDRFKFLKFLYFIINKKKFLKNVTSKPRLLWPVKGFKIITSHFDDKENRKNSHGAIDIAGSGIFGAPVRAPIDMIITHASYGYNGGYGNLVIGEFKYNKKSYQIYFAHLNTLNTMKESNVHAGDIIGFVGKSGFATGSHLHFEVREDSKRIDPELFEYDDK